VLSTLGKHEIARDFAKEAIKNLEEAKINNSAEDKEKIKLELDRAYYNLGVELEHLQ